MEAGRPGSLFVRIDELSGCRHNRWKCIEIIQFVKFDFLFGRSWISNDLASITKIYNTALQQWKFVGGLEKHPQNDAANGQMLWFDHTTKY
jgi:hypothetical protein